MEKFTITQVEMPETGEGRLLPDLKFVVQQPLLWFFVGDCVILGWKTAQYHRQPVIIVTIPGVNKINELGFAYPEISIHIEP